MLTIVLHTNPANPGGIIGKVADINPAQVSAIYAQRRSYDDCPEIVYIVELPGSKFFLSDEGEFQRIKNILSPQ